MKRDDLIHPDVSGNKWRKLKGFFGEVDPSRPVLTFGGAHSNHLRAAAFAFAYAGIKGIAVVRGEELGKSDTHSLWTYPQSLWAGVEPHSQCTGCTIPWE